MKQEGLVVKMRFVFLILIVSVFLVGFVNAAELEEGEIDVNNNLEECFVWAEPRVADCREIDVSNEDGQALCELSLACPDFEPEGDCFSCKYDSSQNKCVSDKESCVLPDYCVGEKVENPGLCEFVEGKCVNYIQDMNLGFQCVEENGYCVIDFDTTCIFEEVEKAEICYDEIDNDEDGKIDCEDSDCEGKRCTNPDELCKACVKTSENGEEYEGVCVENSAPNSYDAFCCKSEKPEFSYYKWTFESLCNDFFDHGVIVEDRFCNGLEKNRPEFICCKQISDRKISYSWEDEKLDCINSPVNEILNANHDIPLIKREVLEDSICVDKILYEKPTLFGVFKSPDKNIFYLDYSKGISAKLNDGEKKPPKDEIGLRVETPKEDLVCEVYDKSGKNIMGQGNCIGSDDSNRYVKINLNDYDTSEWPIDIPSLITIKDDGTVDSQAPENECKGENKKEHEEEFSFKICPKESEGVSGGFKTEIDLWTDRKRCSFEGYDNGLIEPLIPCGSNPNNPNAECKDVKFGRDVYNFECKSEKQYCDKGYWLDEHKTNFGFKYCHGQDDVCEEEGLGKCNRADMYCTETDKNDVLVKCYSDKSPCDGHWTGNPLGKCDREQRICDNVRGMGVEVGCIDDSDCKNIEIAGKIYNGVCEGKSKVKDVFPTSPNYVVEGKLEIPSVNYVEYEGLDTIKFTIDVKGDYYKIYIPLFKDGGHNVKILGSFMNYTALDKIRSDILMKEEFKPLLGSIRDELWSNEEFEALLSDFSIEKAFSARDIIKGTVEKEEIAQMNYKLEIYLESPNIIYAKESLSGDGEWRGDSYATDKSEMTKETSKKTFGKYATWEHSTVDWFLGQGSYYNIVFKKLYDAILDNELEHDWEPFPKKEEREKLYSNIFQRRKGDVDGGKLEFFYECIPSKVESSNSIYIVRDFEDFSFDGLAYEIEYSDDILKDSTKEFFEQVDSTKDIYVLNEDKVYEGCSIDILDEKTYEISNSEENNLIYDSYLGLFIEENSFSDENVGVTFRKMNLSDCPETGFGSFDFDFSLEDIGGFDIGNVPLLEDFVDSWENYKLSTREILQYIEDYRIAESM